MNNFTIFTEPSANNEIYELLSDPLKGENTCLSGAIECSNKHNQIDGMLEFSLSADQVSFLSENYNVEIVDESLYECGLDDFTITDISEGKFIPKMAGLNMNDGAAGNDLISHHLYHCQQIDVDKTNSAYTNVQKLSTIDCSNVDIIVIDTGIDITHPDVGDQVVQFDWSLLGDGSDGTLATGNRIIENINDAFGGNPLTQVPTNYYQDDIGHGTACASLIAGKRSGLAKNAKLYALRFLDDSTKGGGVYDTTGTSPFYQGFQSSAIVLPLALAFLRAKKNNKLGLDSTRPTILSNSWGNSARHRRHLSSTTLMEKAPIITKIIQRYDGSRGDAPENYNKSMSTAQFSINKMTEQIVGLGGHFLTSAGNSNQLKDAGLVKRIRNDCKQLYIRYNTVPTTNGVRLVVPMTKELQENIPSTIAEALTGSSSGFNLHGTDFAFDQITSNDFTTIGFTLVKSNSNLGEGHYPLATHGCSPCLSMRLIHRQKYLSAGTIEYPFDPIGDPNPSGNPITFQYYPSTIHDNLTEMDDLDLTAIVVGCVSPIYHPFDTDIYTAADNAQNPGPYIPYLGSGNNSTMVHNFLSSKRIDSENNFLFNEERCDALSAVPYVKTSYSEFGPDVDVYAPGNGTLAAVSNFAGGPYGPAFDITVGVEQYGYFNGTSAACPVAAGCLATFLADNPAASPKEAKQWLVDSSVKGSILETSFETFNDNTLSMDHHYDNIYHRSYDSIPMQNKLTNPYSLSALAYSTSTSINFLDKSFEKLDDNSKKLAMLHNHRFFRSHNRVVQAYPLRKAIVKQQSETPANHIKIGGGATLSLSGNALVGKESFITHLSSTITDTPLYSETFAITASFITGNAGTGWATAWKFSTNAGNAVDRLGPLDPTDTYGSNRTLNFNMGDTIRFENIGINAFDPREEGRPFTIRNISGVGTTDLAEGVVNNSSTLGPIIFTPVAPGTYYYNDSSDSSNGQGRNWGQIIIT